MYLFEDEKWKNFRPLSYSRPISDLRVGCTALGEKIEAYAGKAVNGLIVREYLVPVTKEEHPGLLVNQVKDGSALFVNSRFIPTGDFHRDIVDLAPGDVLLDKREDVIAFNGPYRILKEAMEGGTVVNEKLRSLAKSSRKIDIAMPLYIWDLIRLNVQELIRDFEMLKKRGTFGKIDVGVHILNRMYVYIDETAVIKPGVVIDAEEGPVFIDRDVTIGPNSVLVGPLYIGPGSVVKMGAKINQGVSLGPVTKAGGEIEETIIQGYSNKQHEGFLGHAYLGSWVNIGADTNNSDLKNTYGPIKVNFFGQEINTGMIFLGLIMGDHSKSGINTMFNTGTIVGFSANVFGGDFPPKFIPSFGWGGASEISEYDLEKALEVAKRVMQRRNVKLTPAYEELFRHIHEITREEREPYLSSR